MKKPWLNHYDPGVPENIGLPSGLLAHHLMEESATHFPNRTALVWPKVTGGSLQEGRQSYRDLDLSANRFANGLLAMGLEKGDRIAIVLPNSPQFVIASFGALKVGAIVATFSPTEYEDQVEQFLNDSGAETVVAELNTYPMIKKVQPKTGVTRVITTKLADFLPPIARALSSVGRKETESSAIKLDARDYSFRLMLKNSAETRPEVDITPDEIAVLTYTSGWEGAPVGTILSHGNIAANAFQFGAWWTDAQHGHEVMLLPVPFTYPSCLQAGLMNGLALGATLVLFSHFELRETLMAVGKYHPTVFPGLPGLYSSLMMAMPAGGDALRSLRLGLCTAGAISVRELDEFERRTNGRLVQGYGVVEGGAITHLNPVRGHHKPGSIGLPLPMTLARVADPNYPALTVAPGDVGELAVQGPQIPRGYWNRRDQLANHWRDGWWMTGEWAKMDEDGFFQLVERNPDQIDGRMAEQTPPHARGEEG